MNIENNKREFGKLGRRDDPNLFNLKKNTRDGDKHKNSKKIKQIIVEHKSKE